MDLQPPSLRASAAPNHGNDKIHKSSTFPTAAGSTAHSPNPRSCVTCRRRKVKCDKKHPCTNCSKAHIECIFPAPGRAPRKPRKPPDAELLARLRRLEGVVQSLSTPGDESHDPRAERERGGSIASDASPAPSKLSSSDSDKVKGDMFKKFGRLFIEDGKSRYVNNNFWANLSNEVEDLKDLLNDTSEEEDDDIHHSPGSVSTASGVHHGFIFSLGSVAVDLHSLHPPPGQIMELFNIYVTHVDPLVKMLHIPTTRKLIESVKNNPGKASKGLEALLFSIYYGSITSLSDKECLSNGWESRNELLSRYRFGLEQALAKANFLVTNELIILQAFVIFLMCLRRNEDARMIWTLTGTIIRIAMTLGLHRDGSHFGLPPFDTEMRRRTFWQVSILDIRSAEDQGCEITMIEPGYDTKLPLNVNDEDLDPDMVEPPEERIGCTEMSFALIRYEVSKVVRRINYSPISVMSTVGYQQWTEPTLRDKEEWIDECHRHIEEKYLKYCDMTVPIYWVTATVSRLIMAKMWLIIYHPFQRVDGGASLSQETKDRLFITSLESIEFALLLESEAKTVKWGWLFKTYVQWHALAFLLTELCHRTKGPTVARAWRAIDLFLLSWGAITGMDKKSHLWRPLRKLMAKARAAREVVLKTENRNGTFQSTQSQSKLTPEELQKIRSSVEQQNSASPIGSQALSDVNLDALNNEVAKSNISMSLPVAPRNAASQSNIMDMTNNENMDSSTFFAAQPPPTPSQFEQFFKWHNNQTGSNQLGGDWIPTNSVANNQINPINPALNQNGIISTATTDGVSYAFPNIPGMSQMNTNFSPSFISNPLLPTNYQADGPANAGFPQIDLSDELMMEATTTEPAIQWSDWDDMVREIQLEEGGGNSWNRRPVLGESWL